MKRALALMVVISLLLSACGQSPGARSEESQKPMETGRQMEEMISTPDSTEQPSQLSYKEVVPEFENLDDPTLLRYMEDKVYSGLLDTMDSADYFVENVSAVYVSKEYLEELSYNSKANIFFGYTLAELDEQFQGTRYVFTLGDSGDTVVEPFEEYTDIYGEMVKNVAIGAGVILVCVTVSAVSGGAGAPAVSMIFAASAKTGAVMALSSGTIGGVSAGIVTGVTTKDFDQAVEAAALAASEGFKWGAITGAIGGGASEAAALKGATLNGLTMNEAATIQKESKYPLDVIQQMHSMEEYQVYKDAGLKAATVNGRTALIQDIDLNYTSELPNGTEVTNLVRMQQGYAPIDPTTGTAYQLHHIGQKADGTLAVLKGEQHQGNSAILNIVGKETEINRPEFAGTRKEFWEYMGNVIFGNGGT